jgi:hypothetical protein
MKQNKIRMTFDVESIPDLIKIFSVCLISSFHSGEVEFMVFWVVMPCSVVLG